MRPFQLQRLGIIMEPDPGDPHEVGGVLNPGGARGRDGQLYFSPYWWRRGSLSAHWHRACSV